MNLYILRHGIAVDPGTPEYAADSERPLVPKGEHKLRLIGKAMGCLELRFDLIVSSPYLRARQTAEIIAASLKSKKPIEFSDSLTPGGSQRKLVEFLNHFKPVPQEVLLVGHEPFLSELISLLVSGETGVSIAVKKGGFCKVSTERLEFGPCATLEWLLTPKQMALMAGD